MRTKTLAPMFLATAMTIGLVGCYGAYGPYPPGYGGPLGPGTPVGPGGPGGPIGPGGGGGNQGQGLPPKSQWTKPQINSYSSGRKLGANDAKWGKTPDFSRHASAFSPLTRAYAEAGYQVGYANAANVGGGGTVNPGLTTPGGIKLLP